MEIMDTPFMNSIIKHLGYEKMVNSPWYKVYPDLGNLSAWSENEPDIELEAGIGSIVGIHIKDTIAPKNGDEGKFKCVPFGSGCVDFVGRFAKLERLGYTGPYMIEMWHEDGDDDILKVENAVKWIKEKYVQAMFEV
jgi:hexulose-6-phosphate isomerase